MLACKGLVFSYLKKKNWVWLCSPSLDLSILLLKLPECEITVFATTPSSVADFLHARMYYPFTDWLWHYTHEVIISVTMYYPILH
jgi:hypothetical protein